eukprot:58093_1
MGVTYSSPSWYVEKNCVTTDELQPLSLIFIGIITQSIVTVIIKGGKDDSNNANSKFSCKRFASKSFKLSLKLWQVISLILVFVFDIIEFTQFMKRSSEAVWTDYQCLASILLSSSNIKKIMINILAIPSRILEIDSDNTIDRLLSLIFVLAFVSLLIIHLPFIFMYGLVGSTVYVYYIVLCGCCCCAYRCWWKSLKTAAELDDAKDEVDQIQAEIEAEFDPMSVVFNPMALDVPGTDSWKNRQLEKQNDMVDVQKTKCPIQLPLVIKETAKEFETESVASILMGKSVGILFVFGMIIFGQTMINLYSGQDYISAVVNVMTERTWKQYINYTINNVKTQIKLISWIL